MRNPTSPTLEEIREWAYGEDNSEPIQDWDLVLTWGIEESYMRLFIELASDSNCPKWRYFLDLLYFVIGYAVRKKHIPDMHARYSRLIGLARNSKDHYIKHWRHRSQLLIDAPEAYNDEDWYANRYPYEATSGEA